MKNKSLKQIVLAQAGCTDKAQKQLRAKHPRAEVVNGVWHGCQFVPHAKN